MRGTVLFKHGSVGVIEDDAVNSFLRGRIDKGGKHYAAMARIKHRFSQVLK
jgi:hypothetical protein